MGLKILYCIVLNIVLTRTTSKSKERFSKFLIVIYNVEHGTYSHVETAFRHKLLQISYHFHLQNIERRNVLTIAKIVSYLKFTISNFIFITI